MKYLKMMIRWSWESFIWNRFSNFELHSVEILQKNLLIRFWSDWGSICFLLQRLFVRSSNFLRHFFNKKQNLEDRRNLQFILEWLNVFGLNWQSLTKSFLYIFLFRYWKNIFRILIMSLEDSIKKTFEKIDTNKDDKLSQGNIWKYHQLI